MKNRLHSTVLILGFMSLTAMVGLVLALSDIYHEYISSRQLGKITTGQLTLPDFTSCQGEWFMVVMAVIIIFSFLVTNLVYQIRKYNKPARIQA